MDRTLVVNASPLILLARLDLLVSLAKLLVLPEAVVREIQAGSHRDETADLRGRGSRMSVEPAGASVILPER